MMIIFPITLPQTIREYALIKATLEKGVLYQDNVTIAIATAKE
jgi:hypothetical protein